MNEKKFVVILNYNNWKVTVQCVNSIKKQINSDEIIIVIVDNGSVNDSYSELRKLYENDDLIYIIETHKNYGFAKGNNIGIQKCLDLGAKNCVLTNSDILFLESSINVLIDELQQQQDAVIVGPQIIGTSGEIMPSSVLKPRRIIDPLEIGRLFKVKTVDESIMDQSIPVYSVSGCCFAIDINRFIHMGAFDEGTFLYNEENILGTQAKKSGYKIYFSSKTRVIHNHGSSSGRRNTFTSQEYIKSTIYYWRKYRHASKVFLYLILLVYIFKIKIIDLKTGELDIGKIFYAGRDAIINN